MGEQKKKKHTGLVSHLWGRWQRQSADNKQNQEHNGHESPPLNIYCPPRKNAVATVVLNGYNIEQDMSFGSLGTMRSFKIVAGDLWDEWNEQTAVVLADENGQRMLVRVAALPADDDSFGLIEFVSLGK
ncbi:MAG: hypothetical protein H6658_07700 [Ardenticatenaceae bacterium]|nr:hypothetical protein [Ardenticatenaceae bacterium]